MQIFIYKITLFLTFFKFYMKISEQALRNALFEKKMTIIKLCEIVGISRQGLKLMLAKGEMKDDTAEKIINTLNISAETLQNNTQKATYSQNDHKLEIAVESGFLGGNESKSDGFVPIKVYEEAMQEWKAEKAFYMRTIDNLSKH